MALGPELIINGDFSNGGNDWTINAPFALEVDAVRSTNAGLTTSFYQLGVISDFTKVYTLSFEIKEISTTNGWTIELNNAESSGLYNTVGVHTVVLDSAGGNGGVTIRGNAAGGATGLLDNISCKEGVADPTTTVEIEWIDSVSAAATGNKIYRDDVEIADIGMGVQTYDDTTAEQGTTYKYEVQAYSATDETTQEVTDVNVKTITTA